MMTARVNTPWNLLRQFLGRRIRKGPEVLSGYITSEGADQLSPQFPSMLPASLAKSSQVDVLIVGAGPAGLMACNALARAGVKVRIIDQRYIHRVIYRRARS